MTLKLAYKSIVYKSYPLVEQELLTLSEFTPGL